MEENHRAYDLKAPGSPGSGNPVRLPGRGAFPRVDDHLVEPEVTRDEMIGGRRMVASPANPPHATQQTRLDYVLQAHVASGYRAATDLLTRHDEESDFATDTCLFKEGVDPETGTRYLEEVAFEVVSEQNERLVTEKAVRMQRRGVRRIFSLWVKSQKVCEWSPETRSWQPLDASAKIDDPCFVAPVSVAALLDAAAAHEAVAEALIAQGNPAIRKREAEAAAKGEARGQTQGRMEGRAEGLVEAILKVLETRDLAISSVQREEIQSCRDIARLERWLRKAALAASAEEITAET